MSRIVKTPTILGGKPRIGRTRIPVATVGSYLMHGYTAREIQHDYPSLQPKQIEAARKYILTHLEELHLGPALKAAR